MPNVQKETTWNVCKENSVIGQSITRSGETNVTKFHQELIDCTQASREEKQHYLPHVVVNNSSGLQLKRELAIVITF